MKKFKYYKTLLTLAMTGTLTLVSGCGKNAEENKTEIKKISSQCRHLKVDVDGDGTLEYFKECDGYEIDFSYSGDYIWYKITINDELICSNVTNTDYYYFRLNHEYIEQNAEENEKIKVFKNIK